MVSRLLSREMRGSLKQAESAFVSALRCDPPLLEHARFVLSKAPRFKPSLERVLPDITLEAARYLVEECKVHMKHLDANLVAYDSRLFRYLHNQGYHFRVTAAPRDGCSVASRLDNRGMWKLKGYCDIFSTAKLKV